MQNPLVLALKEHRSEVDDPGKTSIASGEGDGENDNTTTWFKGCALTGVYSSTPQGNSIVVRIQRLSKCGSFFSQRPDI